MPRFDWESVARVIGNNVAKVALKAAEQVKESVLDDLDQMLDGAKGKIAGARGSAEPQKPHRAKVTLKGAKKSGRKKRSPAKSKPTVIEAEIVEDDEKKPSP